MKDLIIAAFAASLLLWFPNRVGETSINFDSFGAVKVFKNPSVESTSVVILISGKSGWAAAENELAYAIAAEKTLVIGIDFTKYQTGSCKIDDTDASKTLSKDLIILTKTTEQILKFKSYIPPSVIAFKEAGTLITSIALDATGDSFISVNSVAGCFEPVMKASCSNVTQTPIPINIFYDERVSCPTLQAFSKTNVKNVSIQKVSDLDLNPYKLKNWTPEMKGIWRNKPLQIRNLASDKTSQLVAPVAKELEDLPLIFLEPAQNTKDSFVILYSGDGGWSDFTQGLAAEYLKHGYSVIGINSLFYFWNAKTPESGAADLSKIISYFQNKLNRKKYILSAFSFGADAIPFFINGLDAKIKNDLTEIAFIAQDQNAQFKFEVADWLKDEDNGIPILPELEKINGVVIKCLHAEGDRTSACSKLTKNSLLKYFTLKGGHHFNNDFTQFDKILW